MNSPISLSLYVDGIPYNKTVFDFINLDFS